MFYVSTSYQCIEHNFICMLPWLHWNNTTVPSTHYSIFPGTMLNFIWRSFQNHWRSKGLLFLVPLCFSSSYFSYDFQWYVQRISNATPSRVSITLLDGSPMSFCECLASSTGAPGVALQECQVGLQASLYKVSEWIQLAHQRISACLDAQPTVPRWTFLTQLRLQTLPQSLQVKLQWELRELFHVFLPHFLSFSHQESGLSL